jgi:hypothetical protein
MHLDTLFGDKSLEQFVFDLSILKRALKQTHSVCLRAFQLAISVRMHMTCGICGLVVEQNESGIAQTNPGPARANDGLNSAEQAGSLL